jgi:hypothetical protein
METSAAIGFALAKRSAALDPSILKSDSDNAGASYVRLFDFSGD